MTEDPPVRVQRATSCNKAAVAKQLQSYLHDMAPYTGDDPDRADPYPYPYFDRYWSAEGVAEGRVPYLVMAADDVAGFAFVNRHSRLHNPDTWNMAEFQVSGCGRRKGVGSRAVHQLIAIHPGHWEIAVLRTNTPARAFWVTVVNEITGGEFEITSTEPDIWDGVILHFSLD